ncbi:monooxygenase [Chondromyces apiculatus]|uniref:Copper type II ascorbate-dependent monooxygenase C-terminal domain-containing protein n=1 Tax=Chondromyces apiculatus DSM 436 TaxID=1192034 RepID=A0A017TGN6_9BACT|nr:hypothetical protein [Chondromyces apiculatus]EYF07980.1 Hypothetical protein CAP_7002 [Chondromyces apiculatus DSM 436]
MLTWRGILTLTAALPLALLSASCGDDETPGSTGNSSTNGSTSEQPGDGPTYYKDVAPILLENCANCHRAEGIASFSLLTYEEAKTAALSIRSATEARRMPPFVLDNTGECNTYSDARWLTDAQIATIGAWVEAGTPEGDAKDGPAPPEPVGGLDRVDVTFDMGLDYTPDESLVDDYRCFIIDPGLTETAYMIASDVKPGDQRVVHHAILYALDNANAEAEAAALDAEDATPGYRCFGGAGVNSRWVVGWAPGGGPTTYPEGTGIKLNAGRKAVLQVHYNLSNGAFPDRTRVELKLAPTVAKEAVVTPLPALNLNLPPGQELTEATNQYTIPAQAPEVTIYGIGPHMHTLGRTMHVRAETDSGETCLGRVNDWDFHWQSNSFYTTPLTVRGGDTLRITCGYDTRTRNQTTTWGEGTEDEMCIAFLYMTY